MPTSLNVGGVWKTLSKVWINVGGVWKECNKVWLNVGGVWKEVFSGGGVVDGFTVFADDVKVSGVATAIVTLNTNGSISLTGNSSYGSTEWFTPTTTGVGSSYWVKAVNAGPDTPTGTLDTVIALSSARAWELSTSSPGTTLSASLTLYIYSDSGGTNLVATGYASIDVAR